VYAKTKPEIKRKALLENPLSGRASVRYDNQNRSDLLDWLKNYVGLGIVCSAIKDIHNRTKRKEQEEK